MPSKDEYINNAITNVINILKAQNTIVVYPMQISQYREVIRGCSNEKPPEYLYRILHDEKYGECIYDKRISDKFLLFVDMEVDSNCINRASIQAFITQDIELIDFSCCVDVIPNTGKVFYYRLDYDPYNMGKIFKEPLPHLHIMPKGDPRINIKDLKNDIVINFIEYIYRNHFYEEWVEWVTCGMVNDEKELFDALVEVYNGNMYEKAMSEYKELIMKIKERITGRRSKWYFYSINNEACNMLSFC